MEYEMAEDHGMDNKQMEGDDGTEATCSEYN